MILKSDVFKNEDKSYKILLKCWREQKKRI